MRVNGRASGSVLFSRFLVVLNHSMKGKVEEGEKERKVGMVTEKGCGIKEGIGGKRGKMA